MKASEALKIKHWYREDELETEKLDVFFIEYDTHIFQCPLYEFYNWCEVEADIEYFKRVWSDLVRGEGNWETVFDFNEYFDNLDVVTVKKFLNSRI